jgi:1-acyl-sn-glycerol-3-phosphate acyltransferase
MTEASGSARNAETVIQAYIARQPRLTWRRKALRGLLRRVGLTLLCRVEVEGLENIPDSGPTILMMGHISAIDPVVCMAVVTPRFVIPMTKVEGTKDRVLRFFIWWWGAYTVNRSEVDRSALLTSIELIRSGGLILIAPEGTRNPAGLQEAKDGLAYVATKANAVIVPTAISGAADFKQRWKRGRRAYARVTFGQPFRFDTQGRTRIPRDELSAMTREAMFQLALTQPDPSLRGVYSDLSQATTDHLIFVSPR